MGIDLTQEGAARTEVLGRLLGYLKQSGLSARQFASALGTSAPRLSTYLSGKVVPSAVLMVRAEAVAATQGRPGGQRPEQQAAHSTAK
ncbi:MAG: XRE family transcriptional regulator [Comamonadaceae bacterium]|nr:MAG: XRE family transcriptional regulator [Comamonadaceae bacterium]